MKDRLRVLWRVLRGRPVIYGTKLVVSPHGEGGIDASFSMTPDVDGRHVLVLDSYVKSDAPSMLTITPWDRVLPEWPPPRDE